MMNSIYYKPSATWTELPTQGGNVQNKTEELIELKEVNNFIAVQNELKVYSSLLNGIHEEAEKLIKVLSERARLRKVILDLSKNTDKSITNACNVLFGGEPLSITFDDIVKLLKYSSEIASSISTASVGGIEQNKQMLMEQSSAVNVLKGKYFELAVKLQAEDLLILDDLINTEVVNGAVFSALDTVTTTLNGVPLTPSSENPMKTFRPIEPTLPSVIIRDPSSAITNPQKRRTEPSQTLPIAGPLSQEEKWDNLIEQIRSECFPCLDRNISFAKMTNDVLDSIDFDYKRYFDNIIFAVKSYILKQILQISRLKGLFLGDFIRQELCLMASILIDKVCIPDLVSLELLFTTTITKISKIKTKIKIGYYEEFNYGDLIVTPLITALIALLSKLYNTVLSPVKCVIRSVESELAKLKNIDGLESASDDVHGFGDDFLMDIGKVYDDLAEWLVNTAEDLKSMFDFTIGEQKNKTDWISEILKYRQYVVFIKEIIATVMNLSQVDLKDLLTPEGRKRISNQICQNTFGNENQWIDDVVQNMASSVEEYARELKDLYRPQKTGVNTSENSGTNLRDSENTGQESGFSEGRLILPVDSNGQLKDINIDLQKPDVSYQEMEYSPAKFDYKINPDGTINPNILELDDLQLSVIVDPTLPDDLLDGLDITDLLDNPEIYPFFEDIIIGKKNILTKPTNTDFDINFVNKFKQLKVSVLEKKELLKQRKFSRNILPVLTIDKNACLTYSNISGYSQKEVDNWINKILR